nr:VrrA/YqfQ family protein [Bacillus sp. V3B]
MTSHHFGPYRGRPPVNPRMGRVPQMRQGGSGLLSKLLGKGNQVGAGQSMNATRAFGPQNAASGGSLLKTLTNPSSINGFLTNTQKVLTTAQQMGPMIQQYGPIVKNLPAMWKLYRGFKDAPDSTETDKNNTTSNEESVTESNHQSSNKHTITSDQELPIPRKKSPSPSTPKLYI